MIISAELLAYEETFTLWLDQYYLEWRYKLIYNQPWIQVRKKGSWFGFGWKLIGGAVLLLQTPGVTLYEASLLGKLQAYDLIDLYRLG